MHLNAKCRNLIISGLWEKMTHCMQFVENSLDKYDSVIPLLIVIMKMAKLRIIQCTNVIN